MDHGGFGTSPTRIDGWDNGRGGRRRPGAWMRSIPPRLLAGGARLIPLSTLATAIPSLDRTREIVVHCRSGARSATAARQLRAAGFTRVANLAGGILRWSADVDPEVHAY
jgi:rhodanese-related sulfurtransferase